MTETQDTKTRTVSFHEQVKAMRRVGVDVIVDTQARTEVDPCR